jgi:hypothetical protein
MTQDGTLEGFVPAADADVPDLIELAFDYRGDVTVVRHDGGEIVGYLFNRNRAVREPFVQMFPATGDDPVTIPFADIRTIRFTGKDTAAGTSYAAWLRRKEAARATREDV